MSIKSEALDVPTDGHGATLNAASNGGPHNEMYYKIV